MMPFGEFWMDSAVNIGYPASKKIPGEQAR
jgi:hypothetical protein